MKFSRPLFADLALHYKTNPESVHDCSRVFPKEVHADVSTSAIRMAEALVLANRIIERHAAIAELTDGGGAGRELLLGPFGYKAGLCPHGLARGALDLAYFLHDHWGKPNLVHRESDPDRSRRLGTTAEEDRGFEKLLADQQGVVAFLGIPGQDGQGHLAPWDKTKVVGNAYWNCRKLMFWKLD